MKAQQQVSQGAYGQYQQLDEFTKARIRKEFPERAQRTLAQNGLEGYQIENCIRFVKTTEAGGKTILSTDLVLRDVMAEILGEVK